MSWSATCVSPVRTGNKRNVAVTLGGFFRSGSRAARPVRAATLGDCHERACAQCLVRPFAVSAVLEGRSHWQSYKRSDTESELRQAPGRSWTCAGLGRHGRSVTGSGRILLPPRTRRAGETGADPRYASKAKPMLASPMADYQAGFLQSAWLRKAAGITGLGLIYGACALLGRAVGRQRSA